MTNQIAIRVPEDLLAGLDELVKAGRFSTRTAAVRSALKTFVEAERCRAVDQNIIDGYRRYPESHDEMEAAEASLREAIREEPW